MGIGPYDTFVARKIERSPWRLWFAWRPVKVGTKWAWLRKIYRRRHDVYVDNDKFTRHEYADIFDVLSE